MPRCLARGYMGIGSSPAIRLREKQFVRLTLGDAGHDIGPGPFRDSHNAVASMGFCPRRANFLPLEVDISGSQSQCNRDIYTGSPEQRAQGLVRSA